MECIRTFLLTEEKSTITYNVYMYVIYYTCSQTLGALQREYLDAMRNLQSSDNNNNDHHNQFNNNNNSNANIMSDRRSNTNNIRVDYANDNVYKHAPIVTGAGGITANACVEDNDGDELSALVNLINSGSSSGGVINANININVNSMNNNISNSSINNNNNNNARIDSTTDINSNNINNISTIGITNTSTITNTISTSSTSSTNTNTNTDISTDALCISTPDLNAVVALEPLHGIDIGIDIDDNGNDNDDIDVLGDDFDLDLGLAELGELEAETEEEDQRGTGEEKWAEGGRGGGTSSPSVVPSSSSSQADSFQAPTRNASSLCRVTNPGFHGDNSLTSTDSTDAPSLKPGLLSETQDAGVQRVSTRFLAPRLPLHTSSRSSAVFLRAIKEELCSTRYATQRTCPCTVSCMHLPIYMLTPIYIYTCIHLYTCICLYTCINLYTCICL